MDNGSSVEKHSDAVVVDVADAADSVQAVTNEIAPLMEKEPDLADGAARDAASPSIVAYAASGPAANASRASTATPAGMDGGVMPMIDQPLMSKISLRLIFSHQQLGVLLAATLGCIIAYISETTSSEVQRPFSVHDPTLAFKHRTDTVPFWLVIALYPILMFLITLAEVLFYYRGYYNKQHAVWSSIFHTTGVAMTFMFVYIMWAIPRRKVGRPRPDFLSRCMPDPAVVSNSTATQLFDVSVCQNTDRTLINEGFTSFPSGHASFACGACVHATLYFAWLLYLRPPRTLGGIDVASVALSSPCAIALADGGGDGSSISASVQVANHLSRRFPQHRWQWRELYGFLAFFIIASPTMLGWYIAWSRIIDNRHHAGDIIAGMLVGVLSAVFVSTHYMIFYSRWYVVFFDQSLCRCRGGKGE